MKLKLTYFITRENKDGTVRHYWQPSSAMRVCGWVSVALDDDRAVAINQALALGQQHSDWKARKPGVLPNGEQIECSPASSFSLLLSDFQTSKKFADLSPASQKYYSGACKLLTTRLGGRDTASITAADVHTLMEGYSHQSGTAAQLVRTGQAAMTWAIRTGYKGAATSLDLNPFAKQGIKTSSRQARIWTPEQIDAVVAHCDTQAAPDGSLLRSMGTAILMMEWLGHYPSDIIAMMWSNFKFNSFTFQRKKNGHRTGITIKCDASPRLRQRLIDERSGQPLSTHILVAEHTGKPWLINNFRTHFRRIINEIAADQPAFKGLIMGHLRHTAITNMFDAGADPIGIASITGHNLNRVYAILDRYNKRTERQAKLATATRLAADGRHKG